MFMSCLGGGGVQGEGGQCFPQRKTFCQHTGMWISARGKTTEAIKYSVFQ